MKPANLIILLARGLDWAMLGSNGGSVVSTDCLDALWEESVRVTAAISPEPRPEAARAALLSGALRSCPDIPPEDSVFARALAGAGYHTAFLGGWNRAEHMPQHPEALAEEALNALDSLARERAPFALFLDLEGPGRDFPAELVKASDLEPLSRIWFRPSPSIRLGDRRVPKKVRLTADLLEAENRLRQRRYAMLSALDRAVGRVTDRLEELALSRETLVVFTSDGGSLFGDHGRIGGDCFYDEALRIPLFLRQSMAFAPGNAELAVSLTDVLPTVLELLKLPAAESSGRSFAPAVEGKELPETAVLVTGKTDAALRGTRYALLKTLPRGQTALFDITTDPYELNDLAENPEFAGLRAELECELEARLSLLPKRNRK